MAKKSDMVRRIKDLQGKMNQVEFARYLGVPQSRVSEYLAGKRPTAEMCVRLAKLAPYPDNLWFLEEAGLKRDDILSVAGNIASGQITSPTPGEIVLIAPFEGRTGKNGEPLPSIAYPAALLSEPLLTRYFIIDEHSRSYGFDVDDILLLDVSDNGAPDLMPFWEQTVLVELTGSYPSSFKEEVVGRLFVGENRAILRMNVYTAMLQPWAHKLLLPEKADQEIDLYEQGLHLKSTRPFCVGIFQDLGVKPGEFDLGEQLKRARAFLRLDPEHRILGRAVGWIEAPRAKAGM